MKMQTMLTEMVYSDIDPIMRKIGHYVVSQMKDKTNAKIDITHLIPDKYKLIKGKKAYIKFKQQPKCYNYVEPSGNDVVYNIAWPISFEEQWNGKGKTVYTIRSLKHELVHLLDYMGKEEDEIEDVDYGDNYDSETYYTDKYEFNAAVRNALAEYKRLQPVSWNKISSWDKLFQVIQVHGFGALDVDDQLKKSPKFKAMLIELKKEKLIPPNIKD